MRYLIQFLCIALIIHHESFQLFIYSKSIEERLRTLSEIKFEDLEYRKTVFDIHKALVQIYEIVQEIDNCFAASLLANFFWLYGSILTNLHWIGLSLLGISFASVTGTLNKVIFQTSDNKLSTLQMELCR